MKEGKKQSRFEKVRIIATRRLQLAQGAPPLVDAPSGSSPALIAALEWDLGIIPITIKEKTMMPEETEKKNEMKN
ncbi:MAG: DNA-directed RNA polymerase subunit K [Candidatus Aenigmatarchaeota archaeon]